MLQNTKKLSFSNLIHSVYINSNTVENFKIFIELIPFEKMGIEIVPEGGLEKVEHLVNAV